eukprot:11739-Heterococcus_DN1.PRE.3
MATTKSDAAAPLLKPGSTRAQPSAAAQSGSNEVSRGSTAASDKQLSVLNIITFIINFAVVGASNFGLWGKTNATVSEKYVTLVTPTVWQALPKNIGNKAVVHGVSYWFALASVLQAVWSIAFAQEATGLAAALLLAITGSLAKASVGLAQYRTPATTWLEYFVLHIPIGLHAGWVWAAGVVNVNVALVAYNASTETQVAAAILSVLLSIIGAGVAAVHYKDDSFLVSIVWALLGIWVRSDYRYDLLGKDVGRGFGDAIRYGAFALLMLDGYVMLISRNKQLRA